MSKSIDSSAYSSAESLSDLLAIFSNVDSSSWAAKKGKQYTETELGDYYYDYLSTQEEREYNYWLTQDEREYNEYYYNTYESPAAMVQQYQDAGLNPALMYGSGASTTSSNNSTASTPSSYGDMSAGHSGDSSFDNLMSVLSMLQGASQVGTQAFSAQANKEIGLRQADAAEKQADAALLNAETNAGVGGEQQESLRIGNAMAKAMNPLLLENQKLQNQLAGKDLSLKDIVAARERAQTDLAQSQARHEDASTILTNAQTAYTYDMAELVKRQSDHQQLQNWFDSETMQARIEQQIDSGQITHVDALLNTMLTEMQLEVNEDGKTLAQQVYETGLKQAQVDYKLTDKEAKNYALKLVYNMTIEATKTAAMIVGAINLGKGKKPGQTGVSYAPENGSSFNVNMM